MRKLKLQMQITIDGFVAGPEGQMDRISTEMGSDGLIVLNEITDSSDTILLGRKMTNEFVSF